jgi:hypothetical protein
MLWQSIQSSRRGGRHEKGIDAGGSSLRTGHRADWRHVPSRLTLDGPLGLLADTLFLGASACPDKRPLSGQSFCALLGASAPSFAPVVILWLDYVAASRCWAWHFPSKRLRPSEMVAFFCKHVLLRRRFPPSWSAELQPNYYVVRDANRQQLAGRRSAAKLLTKDEARRIAANIASCRSWCAGID